MMSDELILHKVLNPGCFNFKRRTLEHIPNGKFWRGPGHIRFRKAEDLHHLELLLKMIMAMKFHIGVYFLWVKSHEGGSLGISC